MSQFQPLFRTHRTRRVAQPREGRGSGERRWARCPRHSTRRDGPGFHRRRSRAHPQRIRPSDVLVNNAAITSVVPPGTSFEERMKTNIPSTSPLDNIHGVFETNVFAVIAVTQAMLPLLRESPAGRIVNSGSSSGMYSVLPTARRRQPCTRSRWLSRWNWRRRTSR